MPPARQGAVYDTTSGKEVGAFDIVGDTDDLWYDAARKRLYVSGGEGFIDVFQQEEGAGSPARPTLQLRPALARRFSRRTRIGCTSRCRTVVSEGRDSHLRDSLS